MTAKKHPDYTQETERLDYTREYIDKTLNATEEYRKLYKDNIKDAMINLDYLDSSSSYISILINTKFIEMADRNFDNLSKAINKPYFARIDFKESESTNIDKIYIGKTSLFRAEDSIPLIVDWRSPIANVYYEGRIGDTSYEAEGTLQEGELLLKRQYTIEKGELQDILDIDITTNDTFLQASLEANADKRLKDIASTIQAEQNRIIRADMSKPLIVQGVAGSGKTTIALHRIAYFIYTYEKYFDPENYMIIAPNRLFINYISEVLPELGVEKVKQTTFIDLMAELLGNKYKLTNTSEKLITLIHDTNADNKIMLWATKFKGSMDMKAIIDEYVKGIEEKFCPDDNFSLIGYELVAASTIKRMFLNELNYLPVYKRISEIKKTLTYQLKLRKNEILKVTELFYDKAIENLRKTMDPSEERRLQIVELIDTRENKLAEIKKLSKVIVKKYIGSFPNRELFEYYSELMLNEGLLMSLSNGKLTLEKARFLSRQSMELLNNKHIELEDYAPLVYLKHRLFGFEKKLHIDSVVIDEAQDFSVLQFYVLKEVLNTNMFTLLGDISQGIHSYRGIQSWDEVLDEVFNKKGSYMTLVQSYRTTIEIMDLANEIIKKWDNPNVVLAKPVIRHGERPIANIFNKEKDLLCALEDKVHLIQQEGYKSIALIGKTKEECEKIKKHFDKLKRVHVKVLDEKAENYEAGVVLVPSHLAKGLEFDIVFIVNINEKYVETELDIKLLYVAMTRALHKLNIFYMEEGIPLLDNICYNLLEK